MQPRIDLYPTHRQGDFHYRRGRPLPLGASFVSGGINFAIFSRHATACTLVLFTRGAGEPLVEIPFPEAFRIGYVFTMIVFNLDYENIEYGYRFDGPYRPHAGHHFDRSRVLLDPYARAVSGREVWGQKLEVDTARQHRGRLVNDDFDWTNDRQLEIPAEDLIIYEMHVRGFTRHPSSGVRHPGTFAAIRDKIPYLKSLGVNCVELMPIHEFDEFDNEFSNPLTGDRLLNYWGYSPVSFFAPKAGYAATGPLGMEVDELKALVKTLHQNDIEIILDVVFNHTGEGGEDSDHIFTFRGIDNKTYYMLKPDGRYQNFSGCGNTMNCNNPVVRNLVIDCLRYWAAEYHIDGFRFDLASILGRDAQGQPLNNPPLLEALAYDPILGKCKLIAEAWDAGGLYQVGSFPSYGRWAEWNGRYRDTARKFLKGDLGQVEDMALRIMGSPDFYSERGPAASINFITCHDGFTLADLYAYNERHNEANGEENRDGAVDNNSWNCGQEGPTADAAINTLRRRLVKNAVAVLMVSQGVPLLLMGDEIGHSKEGNNNTYCHDNELNWLDWSLVEEHAEQHRFFSYCLQFRRSHIALRCRNHLQQRDYLESGYPDISWHSTDAWNPDWSDASRTLAFMLCGRHARQGNAEDDYIYVAMNMHWRNHYFELPKLPSQLSWHQFANTFRPAPDDICRPGQEQPLTDQRQILAGARSVIILVGREPSSR